MSSLLLWVFELIFYGIRTLVLCAVLYQVSYWPSWS